MKKLLTSKLLMATLSLVATTALFPATALAHSGHLSNDTVHGFLHVEHIIGLVAIGFIAYYVSMLRKK